MHHGPRLAGTPETVCCHQTAVFIQIRSRSVLNKWVGRLRFVSLISDRPRRLSSLEACMSLTGISDLLTLPAYLSHPFNSSTKLSTSPACHHLLVCPAKLVVCECHKPFETLCCTDRYMAMASVLSVQARQGARSGVPGASGEVPVNARV
jgi:hypothetical protein